MKKMKKLFSVLLAMIMSVGFSVNVFAINSNQSQITILPQAKQIPSDIVNNIIKENPNCSITISNWVESNISGSQITPQIVLPGKITKTTSARNAVASDKFVISVAKGSTKKLTSIWKGSLSATCSITEVKRSLELGLTIEKTYSKETTFNGPPESSSYNSREYRVKFYEDRGTFKETLRITDMGQKLPDRSGTWTSPVSYAEYSVDKKI